MPPQTLLLNPTTTHSRRHRNDPRRRCRRASSSRGEGEEAAASTKTPRAQASSAAVTPGGTTQRDAWVAPSTGPPPSCGGVGAARATAAPPARRGASSVVALAEAVARDGREAAVLDDLPLAPEDLHGHAELGVVRRRHSCRRGPHPRRRALCAWIARRAARRLGAPARAHRLVRHAATARVPGYPGGRSRAGEVVLILGTRVRQTEHRARLGQRRRAESGRPVDGRTPAAMLWAAASDGNLTGECRPRHPSARRSSSCNG